MSSIINSLYLSQALILFPLLLNALAIYKIGYFLNFPPIYRSAFAALISVLVMKPVLGQIAFLYSLCFLSLSLLFLLQYFKNGIDSYFLLFLKTILLSSIFIKGYFYLNICALLFITIFIFENFRSCCSYFNIYPMILLFGPILFYFIFHLEGLLAWKSLYQDFYGDLAIDEPRIRQLHIPNRFTVSPIGRYFKNLVLGTRGWIGGLGVWIIFTIIGLKRSSKIHSPLSKVALIMILFSLIFSIHLPYLDKLIVKIPIFGSFRWGFYNTVFATLILCYFAIKGFLEIEKKFLVYKTSIRISLIILLFLTSLASYYFSNDFYIDLKKQQSLINRKKTFQNPYLEKYLFHQKEYKSDEISWLTEKMLISHGYDNSSNVFYWFQKDYPLNKRLLTHPAKLKFFENDSPKFYKNDNEYINSINKQIEPKGSHYLTSKTKNITDLTVSELNQPLPLYLTPTGFEFVVKKESAKTSALVLTQNFHKGWKAYVNQKKITIFPVNKTFIGLLLKDKGDNKVVFRFFPKSYWIILTLYSLIFSIFLLFLMNQWIQRYKNNRIGIKTT